MTNNPAHAEVIEQLSGRLIKLDLAEWSVRIQLPIQTERSQPEPDLALVRKDRVRGRHPTGADTLLVIEVADSSPSIDREKSGIYARAGVPNYWIINIPDQRVETYCRLNSSTGEYEALLILHEGETLKLESNSVVLCDLSVRDLLANS
jgi:Uma2 family endonuclease